MIADIEARQAARQADREAIAAAVAAFQASGGKIHRLDHTERAPHRPISYNNRVDRKSAGRREYLELERIIAEHGKALADTGLTVEQARRQMAKRWKGRAVLTAPRIEQIAAKYGFAFHATGRGRS